MSQRPDPWIVDPEDPRAPPQEIWDRLTPAQRDHVLASLPSEFPPNEACPPEGDLHTEAVYGARTALKRFFSKTGRGSIYVGTNLPVYYPGLTMFSPDVIAVLDVPTHPRNSWVASAEGKGLDFALEVLVLGHRRKDLVTNVDKYASLGIGEYFVFDRTQRHLQGFRLRSGGRSYDPVVPQHGHYASRVLGLELMLEGDRLRFCVGDAALPGAEELIDKLEGFVDDLESRLAAAQARAEQEAQRADDAEARLREALAELERLRAERRG
ncbi:MAG: Uma2 family endonuclease [Polyangiaceae bacterium]|nr:Uma2 family endonuclease [Polyangiaceae bacterium]